MDPIDHDQQLQILIKEKRKHQVKRLEVILECEMIRNEKHKQTTFIEKVGKADLYLKSGQEPIEEKKKYYTCFNVNLADFPDL